MLSDKDSFKSMLDTLYGHIDSANTGVAHEAIATLYYKVAKFTDDESDAIQLRDTYLRQ